MDAHRPRLTSIDRPARRRAGAGRLVVALAAPPVLFTVVFFAFPLAGIIGRGAGLGAWRTLATDPSLRRVLWFTTWQAAVSAALTTMLGLAPAYVFARHRFRGRRALLTVITVPFVLPTVVTGIAFLSLLPRTLHRTVWAVLVAHVWVNLALVVRGVGAALDQLDPDLEAAAATLGASHRRTLRHVTWPLARPAVASASALVFLFCFTSFGIVRLVGGPAERTVEVEIWRRATQTFDLPVATALAVIQLLAVVVLLARWTRRPVLPLRAGRRPRPSPLGRGGRAVVALTLAAVGAPVMAVVARSFEPAVGQRGLAAWRSLAGGADASGRPPLVADPLGSLWNSARTALVAGAVAVALGTLAALAVARARRAGRWLDGGLTLPLGASAVTVGLGLVISFDRGWYDLRSSWVMIPLGQAIVALPVVLRIVAPVIRAIPDDLRAAAGVLGASPSRVVRVVDLGVARRAIGAAAGFAVAVSIGEFGATSLLTRTGSPTAPIAISRLLGRPSPQNLAEACALATLLAVVVIAMLAVVDRWRESGDAPF